MYVSTRYIFEWYKGMPTMLESVLWSPWTVSLLKRHFFGSGTLVIFTIIRGISEKAERNVAKLVKIGFKFLSI